MTMTDKWQEDNEIIAELKQKTSISKVSLMNTLNLIDKLISLKMMWSNMPVVTKKSKNEAAEAPA